MASGSGPGHAHFNAGVHRRHREISLVRQGGGYTSSLVQSTIFGGPACRDFRSVQAGAQVASIVSPSFADVETPPAMTAHTPLPTLLSVVIAAAEEAGRLLAAEFARLD